MHIKWLRDGRQLLYFNTAERCIVTAALRGKQVRTPQVTTDHLLKPPLRRECVMETCEGVVSTMWSLSVKPA